MNKVASPIHSGTL